jgi:hypothetical protein
MGACLIYVVWVALDQKPSCKFPDIFMYKKKINVKDYGKAIKKKGISRETGNIDEGKQNTICVVHHYVCLSLILLMQF